MKRETNFRVATMERDGHAAYAIFHMAKAANMSPKAWHEAHNGELTAEEDREYERFMVEFDAQFRASELKRLELERMGRPPVDELATLRQQVATLTADGTRHVVLGRRLRKVRA